MTQFTEQIRVTRIMDPILRSRPTNVRWRIVALLMGVCLISHFNRASMAVAGADRIMDQFHITPSRMGLIYSAFLLVYSICMIPGGIFIDRYGARLSLVVVGFGSAIFGAATGYMGWACHTGASLLLSLILVRGLMGAVSAPLHPAAARAIGNWTPFPERSFANGLVTAAAIAGIAIVYPGFGKLIYWFGWQRAFIISAFITAGLTCFWLWTARDWPHKDPRVNPAERALIGRPESPTAARPGMAVWAKLLLNRDLLLVTLSYAAVGYFQYLFVYWMQYYFEKVLHLGSDASKYNATVLQLSLAAGMPLGGWLSGRLSKNFGVRAGRAIVSGGGMVLSASLLGIGLLAHQPSWIVFWLALAHAAIGAAEGPFWATAVDIGGRAGGTSAAICNTGGNLGGLLAPYITPVISERLGWSAGIGIGGLVCFLGAICWCWIKPEPAEKTREST